MTVVRIRSTDAGPVAAGATLTGLAGSLITVLDYALPLLGWTKDFSGTNGGAYRQGAGTQPFRYYVNINDNGPGAGVGKEARAVGYETMTAFATGTNLCPTAAQLANGLFLRKSNTADATARPWYLIGDARTFYMSVLTNDSAGVYLTWMFGDFFSRKGVGDLGGAMIIGRIAENSAAITSGVEVIDVFGAVQGTLAGHYAFRDVQATVGAVACGKYGDMGVVSAAGMAGRIAYKNPADNQIYVAAIKVNTITPTVTARGRMRGVMHWGHPLTAVTDRDTFTGTEDLTGKTYEAVVQGGSGGVFLYETSDTWETNT
jgi:hypothetical protein